MPSLYLGTLIGRPQPLHTMTPSAEAAREAVRAAGATRRRLRVSDELDFVTSHLARYADDPLTQAAIMLRRLAESKGFEVKTLTGLYSATVEGVHRERGVGFRATWERGKAKSASWHEATTRWGQVADERKVGVSKLTRLGLAGHRAAGIGNVRLAYLAGPRGVVIGVAALSAKLKALG